MVIPVFAMFYDNSISTGTKIFFICGNYFYSFTITQFLQVLKLGDFGNACVFGFTITQFLQVLKLLLASVFVTVSFTITQFLQVLK